MRLLILISLIFLTACAKEAEYVTLRPDIPAETLTPCPISDRQVRTVNELAALATEHLRAVVRDAGASAAAAGSMFVFQGPHRAVLISYPPYAELVRLLGV